MNIQAIIPAHNEGDILYWIVSKLVSQGIGVTVLDNHSTDNSAAEAARAGATVTLWGRKDAFDDGEMADGVLSLARASGADWTLFNAADEVFRSPVAGESYAQFLSRADAAGANVIEHTVEWHVPTDESFSCGDPEEAFPHWIDLDTAGINMRQFQRAFKPNASISTDSYMHTITCDDKTIFAETGVLKHYTYRSTAHAAAKHNERMLRYGAQAGTFYRKPSLKQGPLPVWPAGSGGLRKSQ